MLPQTQLGLKHPKKMQKRPEEHYESQPLFSRTGYQDPHFSAHRVARWYNGSLMGSGGKNPLLFGPNGRLRSLHTKITSQETPGSQPRDQFYRLVGDLLSQFFPLAILDPLIEEIAGLTSIRLPRTLDEAACVVLAAVEMYLRKHQRMILKEKVIAEIAAELGLDINRKKLTAAKWFLAKGGFWKEYLHDINTATYEILRNLTLEIVTNFAVPRTEEMIRFRRQLYHHCGELISQLAAVQRRPQDLEIYAHMIVNLAAERLLGTPTLPENGLEDVQFTNRVYRAKRQFLEMLQRK
jgi:hypothetical protein